MPRGRLTEEYVKEVALNTLKSYYSEKYNLDKIFAEKEMSLKREYGRGKADGLIAFKNNDGIFVASLEAKSFNSIYNIIPVYKNNKLIIHSIGVGLIAFIFTLIIFYDSTKWFIKWILPIASFLLAAFIFLIIKAYFSSYYDISVVTQVEKYPANEKWIAISTDSYNYLTEYEKEDLRTKVIINKIGLLKVTSRTKVEFLEYPSEDNKRKLKKEENYLPYYSQSSKILQFLNT